MNSNDYNKYLAAIKQANDDADKETLKKIQKQLIADYGLKDNDVDRLLKYFRYTV
jgi:hypothetical protein